MNHGARQMKYIAHVHCTVRANIEFQILTYRQCMLKGICLQYGLFTHIYCSRYFLLLAGWKYLYTARLSGITGVFLVISVYVLFFISVYIILVCVFNPLRFCFSNLGRRGGYHQCCPKMIKCLLLA